MHEDCRARHRAATAASPRAAPLASRPRTRRSAHTGGRARRGPAARWRAAGPRYACRRSHFGCGFVHDRSHFDLTVPGERDARGDLERAFEAVTLDDVEAAEVFLGFDIRTVGHDRHTCVDMHALGVGLVV